MMPSLSARLHSPFRSRLAPIALALVALGACATSLTDPVGIALRLTSVSQSAPADVLELFVEGELVNSGSVPFTSGGCTRPLIAVDSLAPSGWVGIESSQSEQLIACVRGFTVDPGSTVPFFTSVRRPNFVPYPTGVRLRVRVPHENDNGRGGPSREFVLRR
jgi:hypothetical protein